MKQNTDNNMDFEQMREQLALLEKKLESQEIINRDLIKASMRDKLKWIKQYIIGEMVVVPIMTLALIFFSLKYGIPVIFSIIVFVGCMIDIFLDWKVNVTPMKDSDFSEENLLETAKKLQKMKRQRKTQTIVGCILVVVIFAGLLVWAMTCNITDEGTIKNWAIQGGVVGGVVGSIIGVYAARKIYKKMQDTNDEVIRQIDEMTEGEE